MRMQRESRKTSPFLLLKAWKGIYPVDEKDHDNELVALEVSRQSERMNIFHFSQYTKYNNSDA